MSSGGFRRDGLDPFTDLLFNALLGITVLFVIALLAMQPPAKTGDVPAKAELIISASWEDGRSEDIDLWVAGPNNTLVWFRQPQAGLLALDRDDRGEEGDVVVVGGQEVRNPLNREVVTLRGLVPGEYIVNVQYYKSSTELPVDVRVTLSKVNPRLQVLFHQTLVLQQPGDELTAVRFELGANGDVRGLNRMQTSLAIGGRS